MLALGLSVSACGTLDGPAPMADGGRPAVHPKRVAVLVLENRSYEEVIGSADAPYINHLARTGALATRYYAVAHLSLPNYVANIVGQLDATGHTWRAYFGRITKGHNPFVFYESVRGVPRDRDRVVGVRALDRDLRTGRIPDFMWLAPGVGHDGHNSSLRAADRYTSRLVPRVVKALGPRGILYLTWDEGKPSDLRGVGGQGGGRIALIAAGGAAREKTRTAVPSNHYALLRTVEAGFGLSTLGDAGKPSTPVLRRLLEPATQ